VCPAGSTVGAALAIPTILVVDDEPPLRELIREVLEEEGYATLTASNGAEALDMLASERPGMVLMDIMMPVLDGREAVRRMRAHPELRHVPVVMMSAADPPPLDFQVFAFLCKPFHLSELRGVIAAVLAS
jgi:CheY-like chemotaxis protein